MILRIQLEPVSTGRHELIHLGNVLLQALFLLKILLLLLLGQLKVTNNHGCCKVARD